MNEPTDPEKQLRDILKDRDAGAVDLLDEVLAETQERWKAIAAARGAQLVNILEMLGVESIETVETPERVAKDALANIRSKNEAVLDDVRRHLSALREAVGTFIAVARAVDPVFIRDDNTVWHAGPSAVVTVGDCRKLLAAYDGAQVAPTPCGKRSPPGYDNPGSPCTLPAGHRGRHEARDVSGKLLAASTEPAPTLTLEEVDGAMRKGGVDPATARSVRSILEAKIRVAQKGAGRGDGK